MILNIIFAMLECWIQEQLKFHLFVHHANESKLFMFLVGIWVRLVLQTQTFINAFTILITINQLICFLLLECGVQSILNANTNSNPIASLSKMAAPGDWPWHVSLHRDETHGNFDTFLYFT